MGDRVGRVGRIGSAGTAGSALWVIAEFVLGVHVIQRRTLHVVVCRVACERVGWARGGVLAVGMIGGVEWVDFVVSDTSV